MVYDLPDESMEETPVGPESESVENAWIKSYYERIDQLCAAIDQNMAYLDNYINALKLMDAETFQYYRAEIQKLVDAYNSEKNKAYGVQAEAADEATLQKHVSDMQYLLDYSKQLVDIMAQYADAGTQAPTDIPMDDIGMSNNDSTNMITAPPPEDDIITMEEAGPVRAWWDGLSESTKALIKAAAIGATIWGGKKFFDYAVKNWKKQTLKEAVEEIEEPAPELEEEVEA